MERRSESAALGTQQTAQASHAAISYSTVSTPIDAFNAEDNPELIAFSQKHGIVDKAERRKECVECAGIFVRLEEFRQVHHWALRSINRPNHSRFAGS